MDEQQFETLMKPYAESAVAKARIFCRNFFNDDSAENVTDFLGKVNAIAFALGGYQRGAEMFAFQSQLCRDAAIAEKNFYKELANNGRPQD